MYQKGARIYRIQHFSTVIMEITNNFLDACLYIHGEDYAFLVKYQKDGVLLFNEKYANHFHDINIDYRGTLTPFKRDVNPSHMTDSWER